jgi:hypothetical protein
LSLEIKYYEDIESMPVKNFLAFNERVLIDNGIGSDIYDYDQKQKALYGYISTDNKEAILQELNNKRQLFFNIQNKVSPKVSALSVLVKSFKGQPVDIHDEDLMDKINDYLMSQPVSDVYEKYVDLKKKLLIPLRQDSLDTLSLI